MISYVNLEPDLIYPDTLFDWEIVCLRIDLAASENYGRGGMGSSAKSSSIAEESLKRSLKSKARATESEWDPCLERALPFIPSSHPGNVALYTPVARWLRTRPDCFPSSEDNLQTRYPKTSKETLDTPLSPYKYILIGHQPSKRIIQPIIRNETRACFPLSGIQSSSVETSSWT